MVMKSLAREQMLQILIKL